MPMSKLILLALLLVSPIVYANGQHCAERKVAGDWGFTVTGSRVGVGDVAAVGSFKLTAGGVISGRQTTSLAGNVVPETFSGVYTLENDCTGTATITIASPIAPRVAHFSVVVTNKMDSIMMIFTDQGTISTAKAQRIGR
jgi:hypothetical protein